MKYNIKNTKLKLVTILLATSFGALQSCDDLVNEDPISTQNSEGFFQTNDQLSLGLAAAYDGMQGSYATHYLRWGEFRSDNVAPSQSSNNVLVSSLHNSSMDPGATSILRWNELYECIDRTNRVINGSKNVVGLDDNIVAQAYAIRAKVYFDMTRVWGDLPYFTESITNPDDAFVPRTPSATILSGVISDMTTANNLIANASSEFEFSKSSILALMAEVYMFQNTPQSLQLAKEAMDELIALGTHSLVTTPEDWQNLFLNQPPTADLPDAPGKLQTGSELIFSITYNPPTDAQPSTVLPRYAGGGKVTVIEESLELLWAERFPLDTLWDTLYPDTPPVFNREVLLDDGTTAEEPIYGDWRYFASREGGDFINGTGSVQVGDARIHKWQKDRNGVPVNLDNTDLVIYRYADIILLLAEAELKLGNSARSLELVNQIRTARQLPLATTDDFGSSQAEQLDYVLTERRFELLGEGKRWWDLVRNDIVAESINPLILAREGEDSPPVTDNRTLWPILTQHLIDNPQLSQNRGW